MTISNPRQLGLGLAAALMAILVSCGFNVERAADICAEIEALPTTELTAQQRRVVTETTGAIQIVHGSGTAELDSGKYLKVEERADIPGYANRATVFLNGWRVSYKGDDDQHVRAFGTMIGKIRPEGRQLVWNAVGLLRDDDAHEGYEWTYHYTMIAWNDAALNVFVNHDDVDKFCNADTLGSDNFYFAQNSGTTTALSTFSSFVVSPEFPPVGTVAVLPRGFGFVWNGDDHHMLQVGYNLDHGNSLIESGKKYHKAVGLKNPLGSTASLVDSRFVTWDTQSIIKDDDQRRGYMFGEMVSACGGGDVGVIQPPFAILPIENTGFSEPCVVEEGATESHQVTVQGIEYDYAIPMLTGWELGYGKAGKGCGDEHIKEMGIWIEDWDWVRNPANLRGTLNYEVSSVFRDKNSEPGRFHREKVSILVFRPTAPGVAPIKRLPDLVPFSPSGVGAEAFCRLEENRKLLRVSVKNFGPGDAGPSKTTVHYGSVRSAQNTPAIPAGGVVDLLFKVPATCFDPDCEFRILVDSDHQIDETNEGNNAASGSCAG